MKILTLCTYPRRTPQAWVRRQTLSPVIRWESSPLRLLRITILSIFMYPLGSALTLFS
uniref:Uncharacterized protein n=1 Tax=Picea glauca TaxID=3330 RepID=A0A124GNN9_PICGL|nr:hypothetical protein ABT39_MTgene3965 [Picea glauca]